MPARKQHDSHLLARARCRELTRRNTTAGTPERQAVYRVESEGRLALRRRGETVRQALSHPRKRDTLARWGFPVGDPPRWVEAEVRPRESRRIARYMSLVGQLADGRISKAGFHRKVSRWRPLPNGMRFLADPDAVLAIIEARRAADVEIFSYESGRA